MSPQRVFSDMRPRHSHAVVGPFERKAGRHSKLAVESPRENMHRAAVGIVGGVGDQLVIRGQRQLFGQRVGIIGFENSFAPVVQRAVADQHAKPAGGDEVATVARQRGTLWAKTRSLVAWAKC